MRNHGGISRLMGQEHKHRSAPMKSQITVWKKPVRITSLDTLVPFSPPLEQYFLPKDRRCGARSQEIESLIRCAGRSSALRRDRAITIRTAVAEKLPLSTHLLDHVEVEISDEQFVFFARGLGNDLAARIAEIA